jgi:hypothetical protein
MNNMLSFEEVKSFLEASQEELEAYIKQGKLHAYKIGGTYIRFRKEEILNLRSEVFPRKRGPVDGTAFFWARLYDFWKFNNFYIVSLAVVVALAYMVFRF